MHELAWRPRAHLDRESIALYWGFERGNPDAALTVMKQIDAALERVRRFPESGRSASFDGLAHHDYRRVQAGPYFVYYRFDGKTLTVYRIVHQRQDFDVYTLVDLPRG